MRKVMTAAFLAALAVAGTPADALADKGGKHGHQKWEYRDGDCKYEFKSGPNGYKEEVKCDGKRRGPPHWAGPPAWAGPKRVRYVDLPRAIPVPAPGLPSLRCNRDVIGGILGGVAGGVLGNQVGQGDGRTLATVGGALLGVLVGGSIGRSMDQADQACVGQALHYGPLQQPVVWQNPGAGANYAVTPVRSFERGGMECREYKTVVTIDGRHQQAHGTACRMPDGDWQPMN